MSTLLTNCEGNKLLVNCDGDKLLVECDVDCCDCETIKAELLSIDVVEGWTECFGQVRYRLKPNTIEFAECVTLDEQIDHCRWRARGVGTLVVEQERWDGEWVPDGEDDQFFDLEYDGSPFVPDGLLNLGTQAMLETAGSSPCGLKEIHLNVRRTEDCPAPLRNNVLLNVSYRITPCASCP